jgi:broad specificity phosphatase PhoE
MRTRRALLVLAVVAAPVLASARLYSAAPEDVAPVTVLLLRHAETAASTLENRDPPLSEEGRQRAQDLARLLGHSGAAHLFASQFERTQATLAPLAEALEVVVHEIDARDSARQVEALRALPPGAVAVVCGHSNTVPALVATLGGELDGLEDGNIAHDVHDRLFAVTLPATEGAATAVLELRYGAPRE